MQVLGNLNREENMGRSKIFGEIQSSRDVLAHIQDELYRLDDLGGVRECQVLKDELEMFQSDLRYSKATTDTRRETLAGKRMVDVSSALQHILSHLNDKNTDIAKEFREIRITVISVKEYLDAQGDDGDVQMKDPSPRSVLGRVHRRNVRKRKEHAKMAHLKDVRDRVAKKARSLKSEGWQVSRLEEAVNLSDSRQINEVYRLYRSDLERLEKLREKVTPLKRPMKKAGHLSEYKELESLLKDPDRADDIDGMIDFFNERLKRAQMMKDTSHWIKLYKKRKEREAAEGPEQKSHNAQGIIPMKAPATASDGSLTIPQSQNPPSRSETTVPVSPSQAPAEDPQQRPTSQPAGRPAEQPAPSSQPASRSPPPAPATTAPPPSPGPPPGPAPLDSNLPPGPAPLAPPPAPLPAPAPVPPPAAPAGDEGYRGRSVEEIVENGTMDEWEYLFSAVVRLNARIDLPGIDPAKSNLPDYGYGQLAKLLLSSRDTVRLITSERDLGEFIDVSLNDNIRGEDYTYRGLLALCNLVRNKAMTYDPISETDFKYLNMILDCAAPMDKDGKTRVWDVETPRGMVKVTATIEEGEWTYTHFRG